MRIDVGVTGRSSRPAVRNGGATPRWKAFDDGTILPDLIPRIVQQVAQHGEFALGGQHVTIRFDIQPSLACTLGGLFVVFQLEGHRVHASIGYRQIPDQGQAVIGCQVRGLL